MNEPRAAAGGRRILVRYSPLKIAGVLYITGISQFFVFELIAETLYPGYSVARNYISDLGATCVNPPSILHCVVHQPTARIFEATVILLGLLLLAGTCFVYHGTRKKLYCISAALASIGVILAGVFPENTGLTHAIDSEFLFYLLGISLVLAWTIVNGAIIRYLSVAFGALTLFFNYFEFPARVIGVGGLERLIVISALLGLLSLGGYLTGQESGPPQAESGRGRPVPVGGQRRLRSVRPWTVAAVVVTAITTVLIVIAIVVVPAFAREHVEVPGVLLTLLPNLILLLFVASVILWIVTAVRWFARR